MNQRTDIIIYAICLLLLAGAACFWWQGIFPLSSKELVLLPDGKASARQNHETGGSHHDGNSSSADSESKVALQDIAGADYEFNMDGLPGQNHRVSGRPDVSQGEIFVHVAGAVKSPGVYRLLEGQRVYEALELAVPLEDADVDYLNLAGILADQDKIYVPKKGEFSGSGGTGASGGGSWQPPGYGVGGSGSGSGSTTGSIAFPINVNTATAKELEALPGIGPSKAAAIVEFRRQRGPFVHKQDLKKVSGIGEVTYSKIESLITLR